MMKDVPGYLNFIVLTWLYYVGFYLLIDLPFFDSQFFVLRKYLYCIFFAGAYMAKWKYYNGTWSFNGNLIEWVKHFLLGFEKK